MRRVGMKILALSPACSKHSLNGSCGYMIMIILSWTLCLCCRKVPLLDFTTEHREQNKAGTQRRLLNRWEEGRERGEEKGKWIYLSQVKPVLCIARFIHSLKIFLIYLLI